MNEETTWIVIAVVVLVVIAGALGGIFYAMGSGDESSTNGDQEPTDSGEVTGLTLSKDIDGYDPVNEATVFEDDATVYLTGVVQDPEVGMEIYTNWYDEDGELVYTFEDDALVVGEEKDELPIRFKLGRSKGTWPLGEYSVELVINRKDIDTLGFEIISGSG